MKKIKDSQYSKYYQIALNSKLISPQDDSIIFIDKSIIDNRLELLNTNFPDSFLQATAVKTNPLSGILHHLKAMGSGFECASVGELFLAINTNVNTSKVVFDSPAISNSDIDFLNQNFINDNVNANSLIDLSRYDLKNLKFKLGLRINPLVNNNIDDYYNVSSNDSKFGEPIDNKHEIINFIISNPTISTLHVHVGSQNSDTQKTIDGIRKIVDIANTINATKNSIIDTINIGGGFPVNYINDSDYNYNIMEFISKLSNSCPELFNNRYRVITEFGRFIHANSSWLISRVEHIRKAQQSKIVIINVGADMFLRECYSSKKLGHRIKVLDCNGVAKKDSLKKQKYNIAGPLCFAGDFIGYDYLLPSISINDFVLIEDIGANTFSLWSRHCSRPFPKVIAYSSDLAGTDMTIIKHRESYSDILKFWT